MCKSPGKREIELDRLLPKELNGWRVVEEDKRFDPETIFDYINGAGEVYRAFDFKGLLARHFAKEGQPDIYADVFDMGLPKNAFGVFSHDTEGEDLGIGQGSCYKSGLLGFWKGRFFVSLFSEAETPEAKRTLAAMGKEIASSIKKPGKKPPVLALLPKEGIVERKVRYFFNHLILNHYYFVADDNIFLLGPDTDAVLAPYQVEGETYFLLFIQYADEKKAEVAYKSFVNTYLPEASGQDLVQTENSRWTGVRRKGSLLAVVFDAPSESLALDLIAKAVKES